MKKYINKDTVELFSRTNETLIKTKVKGIILEFPGLGGNSCLGGLMELGTYDDEFAAKCAEVGIVLVYMFSGPWSWMNKGAVKMTDAVVDAIIDKYKLSKDVPISVCGGSMGGLGAIIYSIETKHKIMSCAAACPCVDVLDRYNCNPSFARTFIRAVADYDMAVEDALKTISPMHRVDDMRKIPYFIVNCCADEIFPETQLDSYVETLNDKGYCVEYRKMPGKKHGEFVPEIKEELKEFVYSYTKNS